MCFHIMFSCSFVGYNLILKDFIIRCNSPYGVYSCRLTVYRSAVGLLRHIFFLILLCGRSIKTDHITHKQPKPFHRQFGELSHSYRLSMFQSGCRFCKNRIRIVANDVLLCADTVNLARNNEFRIENFKSIHRAEALRHTAVSISKQLRRYCR